MVLGIEPNPTSLICYSISLNQNFHFHCGKGTQPCTPNNAWIRGKHSREAEIPCGFLSLEKLCWWKWGLIYRWERAWGKVPETLRRTGDKKWWVAFDCPDDKSKFWAENTSDNGVFKMNDKKSANGNHCGLSRNCGWLCPLLGPIYLASNLLFSEKLPRPTVPRGP